MRCAWLPSPSSPGAVRPADPARRLLARVLDHRPGRRRRRAGARPARPCCSTARRASAPCPSTCARSAATSTPPRARSGCAGPNGIGYLYVRARASRELRARLAGLQRARGPARRRSTRRSHAGRAPRFDTGFPAAHQVAWALAALDVLEEAGIERGPGAARSTWRPALAERLRARGSRSRRAGARRSCPGTSTTRGRRSRGCARRASSCATCPGTRYVRASVGGWTTDEELDRLVAVPPERRYLSSSRRCRTRSRRPRPPPAPARRRAVDGRADRRGPRGASRPRAWRPDRERRTPRHPDARGERDPDHLEQGVASRRSWRVTGLGRRRPRREPRAGRRRANSTAAPRQDQRRDDDRPGRAGAEDPRDAVGERRRSPPPPGASGPRRPRCCRPRPSAPPTAAWRRPTPITAPEIVCVVESGKPTCEAARITAAPAPWAAKPWAESILMMRLPIVLMIRQPPDVGAERDRRGRGHDHPGRDVEVVGGERAVGDQREGDHAHRLLGVVGAVGEREQPAGEHLPDAEAAGHRPGPQPPDDPVERRGSPGPPTTNARIGATSAGIITLPSRPSPIDRARPLRHEHGADHAADQGVRRARRAARSTR